MVLVSACLAGVDCRYKGDGCPDCEVIMLMKQGKAIPVCPEQLGGCPTPRLPSEIAGGTGADVLDGKACIKMVDGENVTDKFIKGALEVLKLAKMMGISKAVLKARSPSCGCGKIYDGSFSGKLIKGNGVLAELLLRNGIEVVEAG